MASGGVENHEHYQNLVGQIQALNFLREEIKSLLVRMAQEDEYISFRRKVGSQVRRRHFR